MTMDNSSVLSIQDELVDEITMLLGGLYATPPAFWFEDALYVYYTHDIGVFETTIRVSKETFTTSWNTPDDRPDEWHRDTKLQRMGDGSGKRI